MHWEVVEDAIGTSLTRPSIMGVVFLLFKEQLLYFQTFNVALDFWSAESASTVATPRTCSLNWDTGTFQIYLTYKEPIERICKEETKLGR